jgi:hypothetical protein
VETDRSFGRTLISRNRRANWNSAQLSANVEELSLGVYPCDTQMGNTREYNTWQLAEGSADKQPGKFDRTVPAPGLVDQAVPAVARAQATNL